jgi:GGDEF domain-containing protein
MSMRVRSPSQRSSFVGIALLGVHGNDLDQLVEAADAAMYEAKRSGDADHVAQPRRSTGAYAGPGATHPE